MAVNDLTDIYAQDQLDEAMINETTYKSAFLNSGVIEEDGELASFVGMGKGRKITNVGWNDIADPLTTGNAAQATTHNPGYTDDSSTDLIPNSNSTYEYDTVKCIQAYGMGQNEIVKACSFVQDPVSALNGRVTNYWSRVLDMYATYMVKGIYADNVANDSGDMVNDVSSSAGISSEAIIDMMQTMGDAAEYGTGTLIMNSKVASVLRKAQLIDAIPSAENSAVMFEYFQGVRVIVSDQMFDDTTCVTAYAKPGALVIGRSTQNIIPSETYRDPRTGVGSGEEILITRQQFAMGVKGYSWQDDTVSGSVASGAIGGSGGTKLWPSIADQALAANWDRVVGRKNVKLAFLKTNETPAS